MCANNPNLPGRAASAGNYPDEPVKSVEVTGTSRRYPVFVPEYVIASSGLFHFVPKKRMLSESLRGAGKATFIYSVAFSLVLVLLNTGCKTSEGITKLDRGLNGFVTFNAVAFTFDDKKVDVEISYVPHYGAEDRINSNAWAREQIIARVDKELDGLSEKTGFTYERTSNEIENISRKFHVGSYSNVNRFFQNLAAILRDMSADSKAVSLPVLSAKFARGSKHNEMIFTYSPGMFEQRALISFKSMDGNITSYNNTSQSVAIHSVATRFLEYVVRPSIGDSLALDRANSLKLTYNKKPAPEPAWYSFQRIKSIFESDPEPTMNRKEQVTGKMEQKIRSQDEGNTIGGLWAEMNDKMKWIVEIVLPILAFFGVVNFKTLVRFFRNIVSRDSTYRKGYSG